MKLVLDTYRDVASGDRDRRVHALFTFALWFAAGGYVVSSLSEYVSFIEAGFPSIVGGVVVSAVVAFIKFS